MKKQEPFIDLKVARVLVRMFDFINNANNERKEIYDEIERLILSLRFIQRKNQPMLDPNKDFIKFLDKRGFNDRLAKIRNDSIEAGLTTILFDKLADENFRNRFTGWIQPPVSELEITDNEDIFPDSQEAQRKQFNLEKN